MKTNKELRKEDRSSYDAKKKRVHEKILVMNWCYAPFYKCD